jgi:hypothetical protein
MLRRVISPCLLSLALHGLLFGFVLDRPLSLGLLRTQIEAKLARGAMIEEPKLVIIAGSNGPYSHRCETMEPILGIACVNAGVAVGIDLDYLFARWKPLLRPGDIVYLPLEEAQFTRTRTRAAIALGPDAAIMFRHDRATLARLGADRWWGAAFSFGPRAMLMSGIEMGLVAAGFVDPREALEGSTNAWGDHVGHTPEKAAQNAARLATIQPWHATAEAIRTGDGTAEVRRFIAWSRLHGVRVIGGFPAGFAGSPIPPDVRAAIQRVFDDAGAGVVDLGHGDDYPRAAFFDTPDHLNEDAQIARSRRLAVALLPIVAPTREASR